MNKLIAFDGSKLKVPVSEIQNIAYLRRRVQPLIKLSSRVIQGDRIASQLDCPTANLDLKNGALTAMDAGVYAGIGIWQETRYPALIRYGVDGSQRKFEVHLFTEETLDLYTEVLSVEVHVFLRSEVMIIGTQGDWKTPMTTLISQDKRVALAELKSRCIA